MAIFFNNCGKLKDEQVRTVLIPFFSGDGFRLKLHWKGSDFCVDADRPTTYLQFISMEYQGLINVLHSYSSCSSGSLTRSEFISLHTRIPICNHNEFASVCFSALKDSKTDLISFRNIVMLYKAAFSGIKNKKMCVILYRGLKHDENDEISFEQFDLLASIVQPNAGIDMCKNIITKMCKNKTQAISFAKTAKVLFNLSFRKSFNPMKANLSQLKTKDQCNIIWRTLHC